MRRFKVGDYVYARLAVGGPRPKDSDPVAGMLGIVVEVLKLKKNNSPRLMSRVRVKWLPRGNESVRQERVFVLAKDAIKAGAKGAKSIHLETIDEALNLQEARAPTKAEVLKVRKDIRKISGDRRISVKLSKTVDPLLNVFGYSAYDIPTATMMAQYLDDNGYDDEIDRGSLKRFIADPYPTRSFFNLVKVREVVGEAKEDAPNYTVAKDSRNCQSCLHNDNGYCGLFDFKFDRGFTCDVWKARPMGESILTEALPSATRRTFDAAPYANIHLYHVARILEGALSQDAVNTNMVSKLTERLVVALENSVIGVLGRSEGDRVSAMLRNSVRLMGKRAAQLGEASLKRNHELLMEATGLDEAKGVSTGAKGQKFEKAFLKAADILGLDYVAISGGAMWDLKPVGPGWDKHMKGEETNIKVHSTHWMFGSTFIRDLLPWRSRDQFVPAGLKMPAYDPDTFDRSKSEGIIKTYLSLVKPVADVTFTRPKNLAVEDDIIAFALKSGLTNEERRVGLESVMIPDNFESFGVSSNFKVRIRLADEKNPHSLDNRVIAVSLIDGGRVVAEGTYTTSPEPGEEENIEGKKSSSSPTVRFNTKETSSAGPRRKNHAAAAGPTKTYKKGEKARRVAKAYKTVDETLPGFPGVYFRGLKAMGFNWGGGSKRIKLAVFNPDGRVNDKAGKWRDGRYYIIPPNLKGIAYKVVADNIVYRSSRMNDMMPWFNNISARKREMEATYGSKLQGRLQNLRKSKFDVDKFKRHLRTVLSGLGFGHIVFIVPTSGRHTSKIKEVTNKPLSKGYSRSKKILELGKLMDYRNFKLYNTGEKFDIKIIESKGRAFSVNRVEIWSKGKRMAVGSYSPRDKEVLFHFDSRTRMNFGESLDESNIDRIKNIISSRFSGVELLLYGTNHNDVVVLNKILVPKDQRARGIGGSVMKELLSYADDNGLTIALTPSSDYGGSKAKLTRWYRSLGFIPNKGRKKDYRFQEMMYRLPTVEAVSRF